MMAGGDPICPDCKRYLANTATDQYGRHICSQHVPSITETKMTQHDPKDVEALLVEVKRTVNYAASFVDHGQDVFAALNAALAKLKPKPEKLREWWITYYGEGRSVGAYLDKEQAINFVNHGGEIVHVRELTATDAPAQK